MTAKFSERAAAERKRQRRIKPTVPVSENFARMLEARRVPVKHAFQQKDVNWVPGCCAELYKRWLSSGTELSKLKLETVADIAREVFVAESGELTASLSFDVETREKAPNKGLPASWFGAGTVVR